MSDLYQQPILIDSPAMPYLRVSLLASLSASHHSPSARLLWQAGKCKAAVSLGQFQAFSGTRTPEPQALLKPINAERW